MTDEGVVFEQSILFRLLWFSVKSGKEGGIVIYCQDDMFQCIVACLSFN